MLSRKYDEEIEEHDDKEKLNYKHFLLDVKDAILPSLRGGEYVSFQHIKENFTIGNVMIQDEDIEALAVETQNEIIGKDEERSEVRFMTNRIKNAVRICRMTSISDSSIRSLT